MFWWNRKTIQCISRYRTSINAFNFMKRVSIKAITIYMMLLNTNRFMWFSNTFSWFSILKRIRLHVLLKLQTVHITLLNTNRFIPCFKTVSSVWFKMHSVSRNEFRYNKKQFIARCWTRIVLCYFLKNVFVIFDPQKV